MLESARDGVVRALTSVFSHGPRPLENTLDYLGDPGLLGPDSVSWSVIGDVTAFVGGIRGLLVQTAHPEVVAGVDQHSNYRSDPLGRLSRTSLYVTQTTFGAMPEVEEAVAMVRRAHGGVTGKSERDLNYSASDPELSAWVHNALTDSFLKAYLAFGPRPLSVAEADCFVSEQARIGRLLGADPIPETAAELADWITRHPRIESSAGQRRALDFLKAPPVASPVKLGYRVLCEAAITTIPERIRKFSGLTPRWGAEPFGRSAISTLRWAIGSSPAWNLALVRCGGDVPDGLFRQPLRADAQSVVDQRRGHNESGDD